MSITYKRASLDADGGTVRNADHIVYVADEPRRFSSDCDVGEPMPNPDYISGMMRTMYQFAGDMLPIGKSILLANQELEHSILGFSASAGLVVLCSAVGMMVFRHKNLK